MALNLVISLGWELLLRLNHAEIDILLVCGSNLLLLLLEKLNLLCKCELLHCPLLAGSLRVLVEDILMRGVISDGLLL